MFSWHFADFAQQIIAQIFVILNQNLFLSPLVPQDAHNDFRREHGSAVLQWSDECYQAAKKQADACQAKGCMFHVPWHQLVRDFAPPNGVRMVAGGRM